MNLLIVQFIALVAWVILGILIGNLLYRLADFLPRFATSQVSLRAFFAKQSHQVRLGDCFVARTAPRNDTISIAIQSLTGLAFAYFWARYGLTGTFLLQTGIFCFLILVAIVDLKYRLILNVMIFPAAAAAILFWMTFPGSNPQYFWGSNPQYFWGSNPQYFWGSNPQYFWGSNLLAALIGGAFGLIIFLLASFVRPGELGAGDVKLATLIGLAFAFPNVIWALMIGILAGGAAAIFLLLTRHASRTSQIPYAPFLCFGALIVLFFNPP